MLSLMYLEACADKDVLNTPSIRMHALVCVCVIVCVVTKH